MRVTRTLELKGKKSAIISAKNLSVVTLQMAFHGTEEPETLPNSNDTAEYQISAIMEDLIWLGFYYLDVDDPYFLDSDYIDPDTLVREELHRWDFSEDDKSISGPSTVNDGIDKIKEEWTEECFDEPSLENERLVACNTGNSDFSQLLDSAATFFKTAFKHEQNDEDELLGSTPPTSPGVGRPLFFEEVVIKEDEGSNGECEVKMVKVDPSSPINDDSVMIEGMVDESPELLEILKLSFDTNSSLLLDPSQFSMEMAVDTKEEVVTSMSLEMPQVSGQDQLTREVCPDVTKFLRENFPDERSIELIVEDFDSGELFLSSPLVNSHGTLDPCDLQGNGMDEDKCLPIVELPLLDGPPYEPVIIRHPKSTKNHQAAKVKLEFTSESFDIPEENQETVPVEGSSKITRKRKSPRSSRVKKLSKEQEDIRFWQRQEVVEAKNLRPRKLKTTSQSVESTILKTPKPKPSVTKRKRGRPRLFKNLPSSTPIAVKVENTDIPEEPGLAESSPLMVSPIRLIRRLSIPYRRSSQVKDSSSTLSANSSAFNLSGSFEEEVSYDRTTAQSAVLPPSIKAEPATLLFNPNSTYSSNTEAKPAVLVVDMKATRTGNRRKPRINTGPATVVFSSKSSEATPVIAIKTENYCEDSSGCYTIKTETFPPNFENPIKTAKGDSGSRNRSIKKEKRTPTRRSSKKRAASDMINFSLTENGSVHSYRRHTNAGPSTIDHQKISIKREPQTQVVNPKARSLKRLIKTEAENLIPNPKAGRNFKNSTFDEEFDSWPGIRPTRRVRYAKEEYACGICEYKCTLETSLHNHVACHLVDSYLEPMYSCDICGLDTNSEQGIAVHMVLQHKEGTEFRCDLCGFLSGQLKKLVQHRRKHTMEKPHKCCLCNYRSTRRDNLHSHARRIHHIPRMEGDTFTQPGINWKKIKNKMGRVNNNNYLFRSFE